MKIQDFCSKFTHPTIKIEGFTASVQLKDLVEIGKAHNLPVMEDLGSGTLIDFNKFGLPAEPRCLNRWQQARMW